MSFSDKLREFTRRKLTDREIASIRRSSSIGMSYPLHISGGNFASYGSEKDGKLVVNDSNMTANLMGIGVWNCKRIYDNNGLLEEKTTHAEYALPGKSEKTIKDERVIYDPPGRFFGKKA